ncbi:MAG TPA: hypothetical protein VJM12_13810, partial [Pyrinomonadaceae bacterium]|nr:hypothetical protein [Pyrinomonadaceae bacterium]
KFGVPKHSDLEPHSLLAEGNRKSASKRRLIAKDSLNAAFLLRYPLPTLMGTITCQERYISMDRAGASGPIHLRSGPMPST